MSEREQALERSVMQLRTVVNILKMWADGEIAKPANVDNATSEALHAADVALLTRKED